MVRDWFGAWQCRLIDQSGRTDWPDGPEYWGGLERVLVRCGATFDVASEALDAIAEAGWCFPSELAAKLKEAVAGVFKRMPAGATPTPADRKAAEHASRHCPECAGGGLTSRRLWHERYPEGLSVSCYCHRCPMGRWIRSAHAQAGRDGEDLTRRILDLATRPELADLEPDEVFDPAARVAVPF